MRLSVTDLFLQVEGLSERAKVDKRTNFPNQNRSIGVKGMRSFVLIGILTMFAVACGSNGTSGTQIPGSWTITANELSSVGNVFSVTLVSSQCSVVAGDEVFTVQGPSCFIADDSTGQGSISVSGQLVYPAQGVLVGAPTNPVPADTSESINLVFVEADEYGDLSIFNGNGSVENGTMSGTWVCSTYSPACAGLSGTFSGMRN